MGKNNPSYIRTDISQKPSLQIFHFFLVQLNKRGLKLVILRIKYLKKSWLKGMFFFFLWGVSHKVEESPFAEDVLVLLVLLWIGKAEIMAKQEKTSEAWLLKCLIKDNESFGHWFPWSWYFLLRAVAFSHALSPAHWALPSDWRGWSWQ